MIINYNEFNDVNDLMNALLDKVSNDGFDKLSDKEKDLLNKISNGEDIDLDELKKLQPERLNSPREIKLPGGFSNIGTPQLDISSRTPKRFEIGDEVYPISKTGDSLPLHATQHLNTKDKFVVLKLNSSGKIDIGCHRQTDEGKKRVFYYSTNRFSITDPSLQSDFDDDEIVGNGGGLNRNLQPSDYFFYVMDGERNGGGDDRFATPMSIVLVSVDYYNRNNCWDDSLGSHSLSRDIKNALIRGGVFANAELMESVFEVTDWWEKTPEEITNNLTAEGFVNNPDLAP